MSAPAGYGDFVEFAANGGVLGRVLGVKRPGVVTVVFPNGVIDVPVTDLTVIRSVPGLTLTSATGSEKPQGPPDPPKPVPEPSGALTATSTSHSGETAETVIPADEIFAVAVPDSRTVRLTIKTPGSDIEFDLPPASAAWLGTELTDAFGSLQVDRNGDAVEFWDPTDPPGGYVCGRCRTPVESEPCPEHQPFAYGAMT